MVRSVGVPAPAIVLLIVGIVRSVLDSDDLLCNLEWMTRNCDADEKHGRADHDEASRTPQRFLRSLCQS